MWGIQHSVPRCFIFIPGLGIALGISGTIIALVEWVPKIKKKDFFISFRRFLFGED